MPRIHQYADQYADADFRKELYRCLLDQGLRYDMDLAIISGIPISTMSRKIKDPSSFTVLQLRQIVVSAKPNPAEMLKFLGYSAKEIGRLKDSMR